jgi:hypothetical protein
MVRSSWAEGGYEELFHAYFMVQLSPTSESDIWAQRITEGFHDLEGAILDEAPWEVLKNAFEGGGDFVVSVFGRRGTIELLVVIGVAYTFIKDYASLQEGVRRFTRDLRRIISRKFTPVNAEPAVVEEGGRIEGQVMAAQGLREEMERFQKDEVNRLISRETIQEVVRSGSTVDPPHGSSANTTSLLHWYLLISNIVLMLLFGFLLAWAIILDKT